ncbi:putative GOLD domain-containing protein [Lupinus albus]|uniref:Putative GOLD domain-containing protein n=1 Tax=Lupinus albus TaxID=3870 RepID=A0A6A4PGW4_LUPAL|nr:putative GOLD domain-containing protein [Lupinus albus]
MASTDGLVPITRSFLASYYDKCPYTSLSEDISRLSSEIHSMNLDLINQHPPTTQDETLLINEVLHSQPPHKIDENMWKNREYIEETIFLLDTCNWPHQLKDHVELPTVLGELKHKLHNTLNVLESFQIQNSEHVFNTVMTYLPQDFRGTLLRQQRERSERNKQAEIEALVNSGGSIRDRYALLWKQQMDRRRQLAQLGSATGVYKTLVKYLVGVPQVLLDFVRQINDDDGPMEEQRHRYGPPLYSLTKMILSIRLFLLLSWARYEACKLTKDQIAVLEQAVDVYTMEFERFIKFISEVFANSPFFISAEVAGSLDVSKNDIYKEISVPAGKIYEVLLSVDSVNSYIAWDFSLVQGKINMDIGFSLEFISPTGEKTLMLPYRRYESDQGNFCTLMAGSYKLIWDNTYSTFFKKVLRYKVDCIPPVTEPLQSD